MIPASLNVMMMGGKQTDPYYASVSTLLHFEGTNGATSFTDNAPTPKTYTAAGQAQISTTTPLQDTSSLLLDGAGDYLTTGQHDDFDFGAGDFTWEAMVNVSSFSPAIQTILSYGEPTTNNSFTRAITLSLDATVFFCSIRISSTTYTVISTTVPTIGIDYQLGVKRDSGTLSIWVNGVMEHSVVASGAIITPASRNLRIGRWTDNTSRDFNGKIDEVRITKGVARDLSIYPNPTFPNEA